MSRPRVLVLLKGLNRGGAEKLVLDQANWWNISDFEYLVGFLDGHRDQLRSEFTIAGFPPVSAGRQSAIGNILLGRAHRLIRRLNPDVIHAHLPLPGLVARTSRSRAAIVYTEHSLPWSFHAVTRTLNRWTYSGNDAVVCVSETVEAALGGYRARQLETIPNAVAPPAVIRTPDDVRAEFGLPTGTRLVVHVGHIRPGKGHENLLRSAAHIQDSEIPFKIISVGAEQVPGALKPLQHLARTLGVESLISFVGERPDTADVINAADVVVSPSEVEGLPITLLEAMALAKPIVATAVGGVPTLIEDRVRGLLVEPQSPRQLAVAVETLLRDSAEASRMGNAARDFVAEHHSPSDAVRRIEALYRQLPAGRERS